MKCPLGRIPDSFHRGDGGEPLDYGGQSGQPRANIPWCLLSKLSTQVAFSFSPSLFTSRLRSRRGGLNARRWQRRRHATGVFIKPVWMIQGDGVCRLLRGKRSPAKHLPFQERAVIIEKLNSCDHPHPPTHHHRCHYCHYSSGPYACVQPVLFWEARHRPVSAGDQQPALILTWQGRENRNQ